MLDFLKAVVLGLIQGLTEFLPISSSGHLRIVPALLGWRFGPEDAARIAQSVLYVGGDESGPWFAEVRELVLGWLPQADDAVLASVRLVTTSGSSFSSSN